MRKQAKKGKEQKGKEQGNEGIRKQRGKTVRGTKQGKGVREGERENGQEVTAGGRDFRSKKHRLQQRLCVK